MEIKSQPSPFSGGNITVIHNTCSKSFLRRKPIFREFVFDSPYLRRLHASVNLVILHIMASYLKDTKPSSVQVLKY